MSFFSYPVPTWLRNFFVLIVEPSNEISKPVAETETAFPSDTTEARRLRGFFSKGLTLLSSVTANKGIIALIDQAVVSATNFLAGVIIGRTCTKEEFGLYMLGLSVVFFSMSVQQALISAPYTVLSPRLRGTAHCQYTGSTLLHQFGMSALAIVCLAAGGLVLSSGVGPRGLEPVIWSVAIVICVILLRDYARHVCFARLRMRMALWLDSCVTVVQIGGLLLIAWLGLLSASSAFLVIGTASGIGAIFWLLWLRREFNFSIPQAISDFRRNWSLGKWIAASGILWTLTTYLYPWILAAFHGTASAGVWAACLGVVAVGNPLYLGMKNFIYPKIAHAYVERGAQGLSRFVLLSTLLLGLVMAPFCIVLFVFGDPLVTALYSSNYAGNGLVVTLLALNLLVTALSVAFSEGLFVIERADADFKVNLIMLLTLLTLGLWLVRSFDTVGAAFGLAIGSTAALAMRYAVFAILARPARSR